jgi:type II secretion system protein N
LIKTKKWIAYTIYGILITVIFLYVRFPSDSAVDYLKSTVERSNPNVVLLIDSVKLCLPPGIKLSNIEVSFRDRPDLILRADVLKLRPALTSLLSGKLSLLLYADAYEGSMQTDINFANRFSTKGPVRIKTLTGLPSIKRRQN